MVRLLVCVAAMLLHGDVQGLAGVGCSNSLIQRCRSNSLRYSSYSSFCKQQGDFTVAAFRLEGQQHRRRSSASMSIASFSIASGITHSNPWYIWSTLLAAASIGLWSERTQWGAALSSPLVTMLITITLCNIGVMPAVSPVYNTINKMLVPLAVPLLLFDADIRKVIKYAGSLMACFVLGSIGTVLGTLVAAYTVPLRLGADGWKVAAALCSRHIGGAVNYVAVAETLNISADAVVAGLAADNVVVAAYFAFLFYMAQAGGDEDATLQLPSSASAKLDVTAAGQASESDLQQSAAHVTTTSESSSLAYSLTLASFLTLAGTSVAQSVFGGSISAIPVTTLLTAEQLDRQSIGGM